MKAKRLKILWILLMFLFVWNQACAQLAGGRSVDKDEVKVDVEFIGKAGEISTSLVDLKAIPNGSRLPNEYQIVANKSYRLKTDLIEYGEPIITFKVPINSEKEFRKVRVLRLTATDKNPSGYEWSDCTITDEQWLYDQDKEPSEARKTRIFKYLPDALNKLISCAPDRLVDDNYFAVALLTQPTLEGAAPAINVKLEKPEETPQQGKKHYRVSFTNVTKTHLAEVNFYSHFDADTRFDSGAVIDPYKASQGTCRPSKQGSSYGSIVCYFGPLAPNATAYLDLYAESGFADEPALNKAWEIYGWAKKTLWTPIP
jgi:hypothetical protein